MATTTVPRRDWFKIGEKYTTPDRAKINRVIASLSWPETMPEKVTVMPGLGIKACIEQLNLPKVSNVATNGALDVPDPPEGMAHYSVYGIECNYAKGERVRVYVLDTGTGLTPLAADVWEATA